MRSFRTPFAAWLTAMASLALLSCSRDQPPPPLQGAVLIVLDTVRADHLSAYGYASPTSPELQKLASDSVVFEQTVSAAPWTRPSIAAILSGRYPVTATGDETVTRSLVDVVQRAGYRTAGFTEGGFFSRKFGMDQGFETYAEEKGAIIDPQPGGGIANTFRQAETWLAEHASDRFFLLIHTYEPHAPYVSHHFTEGMERGVIGDRFPIALLDELQSGRLKLSEAEIAYVQALYHGDILHSDHYVGRFRETLRTLGLADRTLVVVTSDHGEEMAEHMPANVGDHGHSLYDDLLLVPLIVHDPRVASPVRRVRSQVRTIDVLPTILDLLNVPAEPALDGASLVPVMRGVETADREAISGWNRKGKPRASIRADGYKYLVTVGKTATRPVLQPPPDHELFDLRQDPGEKRNLYEAQPERAKAMHEILMKRRTEILKHEAGPAPAGVDREAEERLRSLGYVH